MRIELQQRQKQTIHQNMVQSVEILQMSAQELAEYIKEKAMENPMMELEHPNEEETKIVKLRKMEWLSSQDEQNKAYYAYDTEEKDRDYFDRIGEDRRETLQEALHLQLIGKGYSDREMEIFDYISQCLDEAGYFKMPVKELAEHLYITEEEAGRCLDIMKGLEPAGVCAGSLKECLFIQLSSSYEKDDIEWQIVDKHMELLAKNQLHNIAKVLDTSIERIKEAVAVIKSLNPRPSQGFDNGELLRCVRPDVTIVEIQGQFEIYVNHDAYPVISVNKDYLAIYRESKEKEVKDYLIKKMKQAEHIRECIEKRQETLIRLSEYILKNQKNFFLFGEKKMKPLRLSDAARELGIHESTVSRAMKDKYLACCWGLYPLSYFFSREYVSGEGEGGLSMEAVKQELRKIIETEDRKKPFSDQKLSEAMEKRGITISRRTVTKYREAMGIPNGRERKEF